VTNHQTDQDAEYLKHSGFRIKELNWETRYCETDIVAEKEKVIYF
jgi:Holliday junction resolvase-like predicted endonuclease